jgi:hypothetical protein
MVAQEHEQQQQQDALQQVLVPLFDYAIITAFGVQLSFAVVFQAHLAYH